MEIQLAQSEKLIKSWNYSRVKSEEGVLSKNMNVHELIVTNKRIIKRQTDKFGSSVEEFYLKDVKDVSGSYRKKSPLYALILGIVLGVMIAVPAIIFSQYLLLIGTAVAVLIGVFVFLFCKRYVFALQLYTYGLETEALGISIGIPTGSKKKMKSESIQVTKITIDYESCKEIVNTIGALILDNKD